MKERHFFMALMVLTSFMSYAHTSRSSATSPFQFILSDNSVKEYVNPVKQLSASEGNMPSVVENADQLLTWNAGTTILTGENEKNEPLQLMIQDYLYGDANADGEVNLLDVEVVLNKSVGKEIIPELTNKPWEDWRIIQANVDGREDLLAYDAALIMQKALDSTYLFPAQGGDDPIQAADSKIKYVVDSKNVYLISSGKILAVNLSIPYTKDASIDTAIVVAEGAVSTLENDGIFYHIGLCSPQPIPSDDTIMIIPYKAIKDCHLFTSNIINYTAHNQIVSFIRDATPTKNERVAAINVFPNPCVNTITIQNLVNRSSYELYSATGQFILSGAINTPSESINLEPLPKGIYILKIATPNSHTYKTIIKK